MPSSSCHLPWRPAALLFSCLVLLLAAPARAAPEPQLPAIKPGLPAVLDPQARVPALQYRSVFQGQRPAAAELEPADWLRANETVRQVGGWRAYAREAAASAPAAVPAPQGGRP